MPIGEALMIAASGFIVVFIMLAVLWMLINVINLFTKTLEKKQKVESATLPKKAAVPAPAKAEPTTDEPVIYGGEIALYDVDEKTAACIMAIVSDETKIPLNQLIFKSIKAI